MRYLSGHVNDRMPSEVGIMTTPRSGAHIPDGRVWAVDTGCFASPQDYTDDIYLDFLSRRFYARDRCLFATAPDVLADGKATLDVARPMFSCIRKAGYPTALVAQDGMEELTIPWREFDVLFLGGTTQWKLSALAHRLTSEAVIRGKPVHMGRVNSYRRLAYAKQIGCSTADGTFLAFGPDKNIPRLEKWLKQLHHDSQQLMLEGVA